MIINSFRSYKKDATISKLFVDNKKIGSVLEDIGRPVGVKIQDDTCIPEGSYYVRVTDSPTFKRPMIILFNVPEDHSIQRDGVKFTGIRVHGGNNTDHTSGCLIVAKHTNNIDRVTESIESELKEVILAALAKGEEVMWVISGGLS